MAQIGKVFLVGAGPGDPGLITRKGWDCLQQADVVVYDRLANPRLLGGLKDQTQLIYVGKVSGEHAVGQDRINEILVEQAQMGRLVVRLKGGDPFIFGRGGEEALYLQDHHIPWEVVPGVSSAAAVPAYAGIPVTHRQMASSVSFITGHGAHGKVHYELSGLGAHTLVFLMGVENLSQIVADVQKTQRPGTTPVAVIAQGTTARQKTILGTLDNIAELAREVAAPAIIIIGQVVALAPQLAWREVLPLFGKRILVSRSRQQAGQLSQIIENLGGEAWEFPLLKFQPPDNLHLVDESLKKLHQYDWVIFTSPNGVNAFFQRLHHLELDVRSLGHILVGAIGPGTANALWQQGLKADVMAQEHCCEGLSQDILAKAQPGEKILLARSQLARKILADELQEGGLLVDDMVFYQTVANIQDSSWVREAILAGDIDCLTFTSSSMVTYFHEIFGQLPLDKTQVVCIGPITASRARDLGIRVDKTAQEYDLSGLTAAILELLGEANLDASNQ